MKLTVKIDAKGIGLVLMAIYIFMCYNATGILFSPIANTLALYAFVGYGLLHWLLMQRNRSALTAYSFFYILFLLFSLISMLYSPGYFNFSGEGYLIIVTFAITFVAQVFVSDETSFYVLAWSYAIASLVLVISLYASGQLVSAEDNRLGGDLFGNANEFAMMIMVATLYDLWLMIYGHRNLLLRIFALVCALANMYTLILSAGRSAFIVPFVFLYILLLGKQDKNGKKHIIRGTLITFVIVILVWLLIVNIPIFYENIGHRFESFVNGLLGISEQGTSVSIRSTLRNAAFTKSIESPIWGHGFDSFKFYAQKLVGTAFYSHCNFTELLYNGGIIAFLLFYYIYWYAFKKTIKATAVPSKYKAFAFATLAALLVYDFSIISYGLSHTQLMLATSLTMLNMNFRKTSPSKNKILR